MVHMEFLNSVYDLKGRNIVDVGAGDGTYSRQILEYGGNVTAIEINADKVNAAKANLPDEILVLEGRGEDLPIASRSQDLVCFFFSFHHVPVKNQQQTLREVRRVLKPDGRLHVVEPLAEGTMFEIVKIIDDETFVRQNSHAMMQVLGDEKIFIPLATKQYVLTRAYRDFENFHRRVVGKDPERVAKFPQVKEPMERLYHRFPPDADGVRHLDQPCIAYHFQLGHQMLPCKEETV